tara:strand:+ start:151 stop:774 length:624 start_codon:yes stop_codon:yes gene_type:complete
MKTYSEKLKDPRWQKKRLETLNRDKFTCMLCGDKETELHINHKKYTKEPWDAPSNDLETLCKHCHIIHHSTKEKVYEVVKIIVEDIVHIIYNNDLGTYYGTIENGIFTYNCGFFYNSKVVKAINSLNSEPTNIIIDFSDLGLHYINFGGERKMKNDIEEILNEKDFNLQLDEEIYLDRITHSCAVEFFTITKINGKKIYLTHTGGAS